MTPRPLSPHRLPRSRVLGAACALLVTACSSSAEPSRQPGDELPSLGEAKLQLERAASCEDLLGRVQDSIIAQLVLRAEQLKAGESASYGGEVADNASEDTADAPPRGVSGPSGEPIQSGTGIPGNAPAPQAPSAETPVDADGEAGASGGDFSGTTRQVADVDEADIVKADGDRIYLLHGSTLFVLQGWPANATEIVGSLPVEGQPAEMFVADGKAIVFSRVYRDLAHEAAARADDDGFARGGSSYTKLSVLDVSAATPRLLRESFIEGDYASSRRHGDLVRAVIQDGFKIPRLDAPAIEYRDAFGQPFPQADVDAQVDAWLARTVRSIRATELGDWLPRELARRDGALVPVAPRCADYYSPDPGLTENGVTSVVALDLADVSAPLSGATILGRAERVYANDSVLLVTQTDYRYTHDAGSSEQTIIHRFDIGDGGTAYTASGAVEGSINDQFSLDERDGVIRVSTTLQPWGRFGAVRGGGAPAIGVAEPTPTATPPAAPAPGGPATAAAAPAEDPPAVPVPDPAIAPAPLPLEPPAPVAVSRVVTLGTEGSSLNVLGSTEDFGQTERIFATRFIGDRGYVVTFRQTDPLFVIDLSDPAAPRVVGELHIPGFSNYLFPLDDDHLFAIGRDATPEGFVQGLALQVFDVSDPARPALAAKYVYADAGDSPANIDHRAISFHADRDIVAFPHQSYATGESTLDVFEITSTRIAPIGDVAMSGEVDVEPCLARYFGVQAGPELEELRAQLDANPEWQREVLASCRYGSSFRRGLFRDDFVYGVSNTGVYVYDLTQMGAGAVGQVSLPAEVYDAGGASGGGGFAGQPAPSAPAGSAPEPASSDGESSSGDPGSEE